MLLHSLLFGGLQPSLMAHQHVCIGLRLVDDFLLLYRVPRKPCTSVCIKGAVVGLRRGQNIRVCKCSAAPRSTTLQQSSTPCSCCVTLHVPPLHSRFSSPSHNAVINNLRVDSAALSAKSARLHQAGNPTGCCVAATICRAPGLQLCERWHRPCLLSHRQAWAHAAQRARSNHPCHACAACAAASHSPAGAAGRHAAPLHMRWQRSSWREAVQLAFDIPDAATTSTACIRKLRSSAMCAMTKQHGPTS